MNGFVISAIVTFFGFLIGVPIMFGVARLFGFYVIVRERECLVYVLFGNVVDTINEAGLHFLWPRMGLQAMIINIFGTCHRVDLRLDQVYLRSRPVNSEEGAPMGIGIWYEMYISDTISYLFRNTDPRGSLSANVSNSTVRCLSNLPLEEMMANRHSMSQTVREEVSPQSHEWGYRLGSVYIRKVHFRDQGMLREIEDKVVNRLRQVTSAIKQDGANQVSVITGAAKRKAAVKFAEAAAIRPKIVGDCLQKISQDPKVSETLFKVLETQRLLESNAGITLIPQANGLLSQMLAVGKPSSRRTGPGGTTVDPEELRRQRLEVYREFQKNRE